jgi:hypothetical protein
VRRPSAAFASSKQDLQQHAMSLAMVKSVCRFKMDRISVADEFEANADW